MVEAARQYEISRAEFERALTLLERERESMRLSRAQRVSYQLYIIFVCGLVIGLIGAIISGLAISSRKSGPPPAVFFGLGFCYLGAILSLILNIPLMLKIGRQKWRLRRLGFSDASDVLWKAQQKTRRWVAITGKIALGLGILFFLGTVAGVWGGGSEFGRGHSGTSCLPSSWWCSTSFKRAKRGWTWRRLDGRK